MKREYRKPALTKREVLSKVTAQEAISGGEVNGGEVNGGGNGLQQIEDNEG